MLGPENRDHVMAEMQISVGLPNRGAWLAELARAKKPREELCYRWVIPLSGLSGIANPTETSTVRRILGRQCRRYVTLDPDDWAAGGNPGPNAQPAFGPRT